MEADQLDPIADRLAPKPLADCLGGTASKGGIGVRLDLELKADRLGHQFDQLVEQEWVLGRRPARGVTDVRRPDLLGGPLVRPAVEGGPEREQGIVQEGQATVGGQADVGLETFNRTRERVPKRGGRGVRTVMAAEPVGV